MPNPSPTQPTPHTPRPPFLTAAWHNLVMLNYELDPTTAATILNPRLPDGCELDFLQTANGPRTFLSIVGFEFLNTRVLNIPIPFHRDFEEVNLRFYVTHTPPHSTSPRRGVVFIKELVPRWAIALVANTVYGENYQARPMSRSITLPNPTSPTQKTGSISYGWIHNAIKNSVSATISGKPTLMPEDSEECFITEHYWGYAKHPRGGTTEYQVEHPRWKVWRAETSNLTCDVAALYGPEFAPILSQRPYSAFVADGSDIIVRQGTRILPTPPASPATLTRP